MKIPIILLLLCLQFLNVVPQETTEDTFEYRIVQLPNGKIKGRTRVTPNNLTYYAFHEIPFASSPTGELRFKEPIPPPNWEDTRDATSNTKICVQFNIKTIESFTPDSRESEDCLYLNVYTPLDPTGNSNVLLPVYFWIYGGAYVQKDGTFEALGPDFLIEYNIVIVTINYRLGPLGFLSTQDETIPGNNALKDQALALRWVNENIHLFKGDRNSITIGGQSAGSACVGYQILNVKNEGLFKTAIMESGTTLNYWSFQKQPRNIAYQLAKVFDQNISESRNSSEDLLKLLQGVSYADLRNAMVTADLKVKPSRDYTDQLGEGYFWAPVLENSTSELFTLPEPMYESLQKGNFIQVPILIGMNSEEMIPLINESDFYTALKNYDQNISYIVLQSYNLNDSDKIEFAQQIKQIYTQANFSDDIGNSLRLRSDARFTTSIIRNVYLQSMYTDVYFYQFSYSGNLQGQTYPRIGESQNVPHAADLQYFWRNSKNSNLTEFSETDRLVQKRMLTLWTNFIIHSDPTYGSGILPQCVWPKVKANNIKYLNINETLEIRSNPKEYRKWIKVIDKYGNPPFYTY